MKAANALAIDLNKLKYFLAAHQIGDKESKPFCNIIYCYDNLFAKPCSNDYESTHFGCSHNKKASTRKEEKTQRLKGELGKKSKQISDK